MPSSLQVLNNEFIIDKLIGQGTFAKVYAVHRKSNFAEVPLVVKSISLVSPDTGKPDPKQRLFVEREIAAMLQLNGHPNFAKLLDVFEDANIPNTVHIVQEQVTNSIELFDFLKSQESGHVDEVIVKKIIFQVLNALAFAHSRGVLHRDIKLDNVLIQPEKNYHVTIIDHGLATLFSETSVLTEAVGCIHYAAPPILLAAEGRTYRPEDGWLDVWSTGVLAYGLLQGYFPYRHTQPGRLLREIMQTSSSHPQPKPLGFKLYDNVSQEAADFVRSVLNPDLRPTALQVLQHSWFDEVRQVEFTRYVHAMDEVEPLFSSIPMACTDLDWKVQLDAVHRYRVGLQTSRNIIARPDSPATIYESDSDSAQSASTLKASKVGSDSNVRSDSSSERTCRMCWEEVLADGTVVIKKPNPVNLFKKWFKKNRPTVLAA